MYGEFGDFFDNLLLNALTITAMTRCGKAPLFLAHMHVAGIRLGHREREWTEGAPQGFRWRVGQIINLEFFRRI